MFRHTFPAVYTHLRTNCSYSCSPRGTVLHSKTFCLSMLFLRGRWRGDIYLLIHKMFVLSPIKSVSPSRCILFLLSPSTCKPYEPKGRLSCSNDSCTQGLRVICHFNSEWSFSQMTRNFMAGKEAGAAKKADWDSCTIPAQMIAARS